MKKLPLALAALVAAACSSTPEPAAGASPSGGPALRATLEPAGEPRAGGPVRVEFTLTNAGAEVLHVLTWYTPLEGSRNTLFEVVSADGTVHRYRGIMAKRLPPPAEAYVTLAPGATERRVLDLSGDYGVTEPGTYRVRLMRPIPDVVPAGGTVPSRPGDHRPVALGDLETTVVVRP